MRNPNRIKPFLNYIEQMWNNNPDLRFGQLLVNLGIVDDSLRTWNAEMTDYFIPHQFYREIQTWKSLNEDSKPISKLTTSHIKAILKTETHIKDTPMERLLKEELKFRKKNKIK